MYKDSVESAGREPAQKQGATMSTATSSTSSTSSRYTLTAAQQTSALVSGAEDGQTWAEEYLRDHEEAGTAAEYDAPKNGWDEYLVNSLTSAALEKLSGCAADSDALAEWLHVYNLSARHAAQEFLDEYLPRITKITVQVLEGNLEAEGTEELSVDKYVAMLEAALEKAFPGAEVDVDMHYGCSGYCARPSAEGHWRHTGAAEDIAEDIANQVWMAWCESAA